MKKYVFLTVNQQVYISTGPTQREAYIRLCQHFGTESLGIVASYKVNEEVTNP